MQLLEAKPHLILHLHVATGLLPIFVEIAKISHILEEHVPTVQHVCNRNARWRATRRHRVHALLAARLVIVKHIVIVVTLNDRSHAALKKHASGTVNLV